MEKIFYIAQILHGLNIVFALLLGLSIITLIVLAVWYVADGLDEGERYGLQDEAKFCRKWLKTSLITGIIASLAVIFVPRRQTYLFMVGGHALEEIAKNEKVQESKQNH